jgi:hypothetical protein
MNDDRWPALPYAEWKDTYHTLHMWMQIVGKVALAYAPPLNHCWGVAFHVTTRGLATRILSRGDRSFAIEFDFVDHRLIINVSDGEQRMLPLVPTTVAEFYRDVMATLHDLNLPVTVWSMPVEIPSPVRFEKDIQHHSYDPEYANRFWRILAQVERVFTARRCEFVGKASPAHFFWGACDLALTRFSGRLAPPREGPAFMRDAYSHEVISHGFWPGSPPVLEPAFYAYAVPQPPGFGQARVQPEAAFYHEGLGEFVLPYEAVRTAPSPDRALSAFVDSTYAEAASLARWDCAALERTPV